MYIIYIIVQFTVNISLTGPYWSMVVQFSYHTTRFLQLPRGVPPSDPSHGWPFEMTWSLLKSFEIYIQTYWNLWRLGDLPSNHIMSTPLSMAQTLLHPSPGEVGWIFKNAVHCQCILIIFNLCSYVLLWVNGEFWCPWSLHCVNFSLPLSP